jgi:hypothetical protein
LELEEPIVFETGQEELREPYIEIIEPAAGNRLVTAIEVLSPDNKIAGLGRKNYLKKRNELRRARAKVVEIDLLRVGRPTLRIAKEDLARLPRWHYLTIIARRPKRHEVYPIALEKRLPVIAIPLGKGDPDVPLDLQAAFTRVWEEGPYPALLKYDGPPPGKWSDEEIAWCAEQLRHAGFHAKA